MLISHKLKSIFIKFRDDPIIVLGAHRSGTTLLARILCNLGLFMGYTLKKHLEAAFFRNANEWILQTARGNWDTPLNAQHLLESPKLRTAVEQKLHKQINSKRFLQSYIGPSNIDAFYRNPKFIWGWKDPRTIITWPIWHTIFPRAKYIFTYRNGIDVANSLKTREEKRKSLNLPHLSTRCFELDGAFNLWERYNSIFYNYLQRFGNINLLQVRFENLLLNPLHEIKKLARFLGLLLDDSKIIEISKIIDIKKIYSFSNYPNLIEFYNKKRNSPFMKKFGYDNIKSDKEIKSETVK